MRTLKVGELVDLLIAVGEAKKTVARLQRENNRLELLVELERLGTLYSLLPIDQLIERVVESECRIKGAA